MHFQCHGCIEIRLYIALAGCTDRHQVNNSLCSLLHLNDIFLRVIRDLL
jgi:hypothetical protein